MANLSLRLILQQLGFSNIDTWLGIANAESGGNPGSIHNNVDPSLPNFKPESIPAGNSPEFSVGLFQINLGPGTGRMDSSGKLTQGAFKGQDWKVLLDPFNNAQYAKGLGSFSNWSTYLNGSYQLPRNYGVDKTVSSGGAGTNDPSLPGIGSVLNGDLGKAAGDAVGNLNPLKDLPTTLLDIFMRGAIAVVGIGLIYIGFVLAANANKQRAAGVVGGGIRKGGSSILSNKRTQTIDSGGNALEVAAE